jgi:uncharacterized repeat protein (TIGR01451 family)
MNACRDKVRSHSSKASTRVSRCLHRPLLETLETRQLLSTVSIADISSGPLTLTPAAQAAGFSLSTLASGFPSRGDGLGPFGVAFPATGGVLVTDGAGNVRLFPTDADGQNAASFPPVAGAKYAASDPSGLARIGNTLYMALGQTGEVVQVNSDGTVNQVIVHIASADGVTANPLNGHLFVSAFNGAIYDVDPVAKTATVFANVAADGLAFDPSSGTLYAALYSAGGPGNRIEGFDINTKAVVFDSGTVTGGPDGIALGTGTRVGNLFVNTNSGTVVEVNLVTKAQTLIASGGTRGDFVAVDPRNDTLIVSQTDRLARLTPPPGSGFVGGSSADLGIRGGGPTVVLVGNHATYNFVVSVTAPGDAHNVVFTDTLPMGASFVSATTSQGTFSAANGVVTFQIGDMSSETPPVNLSVVVTLNVAGQVSNQATVTATETDPTPNDNSLVTPTMVVVPQITDGPLVQSVVRTGIHAQPTVLVLTFSDLLNMGTAESTANYVILTRGRDGRFGSRGSRRIAVDSAVYLPDSRQVILRPHERLNFHLSYELIVNGLPPSGLTSEQGVPLDGAATGQPGSNFTLVMHGLGVLFSRPQQTHASPHAAAVDAVLAHVENQVKKGPRPRG